MMNASTSSDTPSVNDDTPHSENTSSTETTRGYMVTETETEPQKQETHTSHKKPIERTIAAQIFSDQQIVSVLSDLVAILEHIKYEGKPAGARVFQTAWARKLFYQSLPPEMHDFDIEKWYTRACAGDVAPKVNEFTGTIDSSYYNAEIKTDWVIPLIFMEQIYSGFIKTLHGLLSLEKQSHAKMNQYQKMDCMTDLFGIGASSSATTASTSSAGIPTYTQGGSMQRQNFITWK